MENKIPFTSYDFWAYLSAGFLLLFVVDEVAGSRTLQRDNWTIVQGVIAASCAYVVGQLVASLSSWLFERQLIARALGYPRNVLFGATKAPRWLRWALAGYFEPLPVETQRAALARGAPAGAEMAGEALFWIAYARARESSVVMGRLENFLNQFSFARNAALVAYISAAALYWSYSQHFGRDEHLTWALVAMVAGMGMTLRYLKFYRHYAVEVFTSFAYSKEFGTGSTIVPASAPTKG